jgi:hypothetical protein
MNDCKHERCEYMDGFGHRIVTTNQLIKITFCPDCGTKLTPPPEPVYVTELERRALDIALDKEYHDCGDLTPTYKGLRSLLARSRIKETE